MTVGIPRFLNFPFSGFGMLTRFTGVRRYCPRQDRTRQLAGVLADALPKFFGFHPVYARSPLVDLDVLGATSCARDLHPLDLAHVGRTAKRKTPLII